MSNENRKRGRLALRALCEGAIFVAAAQVLSLLKLYRMPWDGEISLAMLPLFIYSVRWGVGRGALAGLVMGILAFTIGGGLVIGWQSIIGDYLAAFTAIGLAGLCRGRRGGLFAGSAVGAAGYFLCVYVTGATLWASYMPERFFGMTMTSPWIYSALYNLSYIIPSLAACLAAEAVLIRPLKKYLTGADLR